MKNILAIAATTLILLMASVAVAAEEQPEDDSTYHPYDRFSKGGNQNCLIEAREYAHARADRLDGTPNIYEYAQARAFRLAYTPYKDYNGGEYSQYTCGANAN